MGNTTRRQPVNFGIPSAPDYKFLNVVDFRGIDVSDNPFVVKQNTASDALNVYVDESNALTTRPRLNQKYQTPMVLRADYVSTLFAYRLNNKVLFQCQMTNGVKFYLKYDTEDTVTEIVSSFAFDDTKYAVFEDNGKIYLANNNGYYVIKSDNKAYNVFGDEDTHVPTTKTGFVNTGKDAAVTIGMDNLLTNKFRVSYHWDLESDYSNVLVDGGKVVKNNYVDYNLFDAESVVYTLLQPYDNDFLVSLTNELKYKITARGSTNFVALSAADLPNDFDTTNITGRIYKGRTDFEEDVKGAEYLINAEDDGDGNKTFYTLKIEYVDEYKNEVYFTTNSSVTSLSYIDIQQPIFNISTGGASKFKQIEDRSDVPFAFDGILYKGYSNMPECFVGCEFSIMSTYDALVYVSSISIVHISNGVVYFTHRIPLREKYSVAEQMSTISVYRTDNTTTKLSGYMYNATDGLKHEVELTAIAPKYYTLERDDSLCCYNPKANAFVTGNSTGFYLRTGAGNKKEYAFLPTYAYARDYVFDGVARKNIYVSDDASVVIAAVINKEQLGVETAYDWQIKSFTKTESTYKESVIYTNEDSNFPYYFLNMHVSSDLTTICFYGENITTSTYSPHENIKFIRHVGLSNQDVVGVSCSAIPVIPTTKRQTAMFSNDLTRMAMADTTSNTLTCIIFNLENVSYLEKTKKVPNGLYVWSMSPDGLFVSGAINAQNTHADLYRWYVDSNSLIYISSTDERLMQGEYHSPNLFGVTTDGKSMYGIVEHYINQHNYSKKFYVSTVVPSTEPLLIVEYPKKEKETSVFFNGYLRFDNNYFFYGGDNKLYITDNNNPTFVTRSLQLGKTDDPVTDMLLIAYDTAMAFKEKNMYVIQPIATDGVYGYQGIEAKSTVGAVSPQAAIISPLTETPLYVGLTGVYAIQSLKNVQSTDKISVLYSEAITNLKDSEGNLKFMDDLKKKNIISTKRLYWSLFVSPDEETSNIYLLDDRTASWFVWTMPVKIIGCWAEEDVIYLADNNGKVYDLSKTDIINKYNPNVTEYYDDGGKLIDWYWKSQILPMGTINYSKKLIDTTFILSDTDCMDEYGLNYKYRIFRKSATETKETTIQNDINYVQSTTKRTLIPRFNFIQLELSNIEDDLNNNKLRLIGLGLKYVLLEGLY